MAPVVVEQRTKVDVRESIPIRAHEGFPTDQRPKAPQPPTGHGLETGVDDPNAPIELAPIQHRHRAIPQIQNEIALLQHDVPEVLLDHFGFVAAGDQKLLVAVAGVQRHDMPENRSAADLDHGLGAVDRLFRDPGPAPARENHDLHAHTTLGAGSGKMNRPPAARYAACCAMISSAKFQASRSR